MTSTKALLGAMRAAWKSIDYHTAQVLKTCRGCAGNGLNKPISIAHASGAR
jgi:hypothetical protein